MCTASEQSVKTKLCQVSCCFLGLHKWTEMVFQQRQEIYGNSTHIHVAKGREDPPREWVNLCKLNQCTLCSRGHQN